MLKFTLHFATINTLIPVLHGVRYLIFTLHFATINTKFRDGKCLRRHNLHYTLLLLIPLALAMLSFIVPIYITLCYY